MSDHATVLFDLPGPTALRRHRIIAIAGGLVILAIVAGIVYGLRDALSWPRWQPIFDPITWRAYFLPGLLSTLTAAVVAVATSGVLGIVLGLGRLSHVAPIRWVSSVIVEFFRSVPVLMMMLFFYYVFVYSKLLTGQTASFAGVVGGLTFYNASVIAELVRSGVNALPRGQTEAGYAIGLTRGQTLLSILLPQAITAMLPALISQLIVVLKDTALGYIIVYPELIQSAERLAAFKGNLIVAYFVVAVLFVIINYGLSILAHWVEGKVRRRTSGGIVHAAAGAPPLVEDVEADPEFPHVPEVLHRDR